MVELLRFSKGLYIYTNLAKLLRLENFLILAINFKDGEFKDSARRPYVARIVRRTQIYLQMTYGQFPTHKLKWIYLITLEISSGTARLRSNRVGTR